MDLWAQPFVPEVHPSPCAWVLAMSMSCIFSDVFEGTEQDNVDDFMTENVPLDYLKVFESPVEESMCELQRISSPSSSSSSPALTQQFDIASFFDTSIKPKELFANEMQSNDLHMFMSPAASMEKKVACLGHIMRASFIREGHASLLETEGTRRRVNKKSSHPEIAIRRLIHGDRNVDEAPTGLDRKNGMDEAMRCVSVHLNVPFKIARAQVRLVWNALPMYQRNLWSVKKGLTLKTMVYARGVGWSRKMEVGEESQPTRRDRSRMDSLAVSCVGFIATWFTTLGVDHPAVIRWVQEGLQGDALREKLLTLTAFKTHFEAFSGWVQKLGQTFASCQPACSMEMCYNGSKACQIHLHAFFGPEVSFRGLLRKPVEMNATWQQLEWGGHIPHLETMKGGGRALATASRRGLYYITMDKVGMLYRSSKVWPHEDNRLNTLASTASWKFGTSQTQLPLTGNQGIITNINLVIWNET